MAHEIGILRSLPNGESLFVGSSSGVFFINTVRRAFSQAANRRRIGPAHAETSSSLPNFPSPEECIFGPDTHGPASQLGTTAAAPDPGDLVELPSHVVAKELIITYFRTWHPILPFLHGPTCLEDLESLYASEASVQSRRQSSRSTTLVLRCLFNIAKLERPDLPQLGKCSIRSEEQLLLALSEISLKRDLGSIQALLAAQLYFVATMSLQAASTTGGIILRSIYKSGLHRCPVRYANLSADDRDMRKRLFWSAYCLDRFLSQSLGHPLGIQDSDIDVCQPGQSELHEPVLPMNRPEEGTSLEETILHLPANHPQRLHRLAGAGVDRPQTPIPEDSLQELDGEQPFEASSTQGVEEDAATQRRSQNQSAQIHFVRYCRFVGRMLEMFHKSIHVRSASRQNILFLKADIDLWANNMPYSFISSLNGSALPMRPDSASCGLNQDLFFEIARQQLLLLVNRPSLSLEPTAAEFRHAIQICIGAAKSIIRILDSDSEARGTLCWPGFMSAVWMSGLIMVFACQLRLHNVANATNDITAALRVLQAMTGRWIMAQNCHDVLSMLLEGTKNNKRTSPDVNTDHSAQQPFRPRPQGQLLSQGQKRPGHDVSSHTDERYNTRLRLSGRPSPRNRPSSAAIDPGDRAGSSNPGFDPSQERTLRYSAGYDHYDMNGQATDSTTITDPYCFSNVQHAEYMSSILGASTNHQSGQVPHQFIVTNPFGTNDSQATDWTLPSRFESMPAYDVFDGAMWGSLMELVEPDG